MSERLEDYLAPGDVLDGVYSIESVAGYGAFGPIYRAKEERSGRVVAVKAMPPGVTRDHNTALARFERELQVVQCLAHEHIVALYENGTDSAGVRYMILEYVEGETLDIFVRREQVGLAVALGMTRQIALALEQAHELGVIHRDLKPANVLVEPTDEGPRVKVLDFGMAKLLTHLGEARAEDLTKEGMAVGTPRYIAPEQARGEEVGPWTDLYALGLLFYEMVTGERAVKSDSVAGAVGVHISPEPLPLEELEEVPELVRPLLHGLLQKDPLQRFRDTAEVLDEVAVCLDDLAFGQGQGEAGSARGPGERASWAPRPSRVPDLVAADVEELELDWASLERDNSASSANSSTASEDDGDQEAGSPNSSRDETDGREGTRRGHLARYKWVVELACALFLAAAAFITLTAHLGGWSFEARVSAGLAAPFFASGVYKMLDRLSWGWGYSRLLIFWSMLQLGLGHGLGLQTLITHLVMDSAWFLAPIEHVYGVEHVGRAVEWASRGYAMFLSLFVSP